MFSQSTFIDLCESELRLCALARGESLVVLSQGNERSEYVDAFMAAAQRLGASAMNLRLPYSSSASDGDVGVWTVGNTPLRGNRAAVEVLKAADMVVETLFLLFSAELTEIQSAGTRILTCIEPIDLLARLFPTEELRRRTDVAAELLGGASTLRFTNPAGSDVTYRIGYPVKAQYGFVDQPGGWDHWPSGGLVITGGEDDGVDGRVVVAPGDILLPFKRYVAEPIEFTIEAGRILAIEGGVDAALVRQYMADFDDPDAYGLSHIGWGIDERAKWSALATDSAATAWSCGPSPATCSSRRARTSSSAARTTRSATSTSRCATAACTSTSARSSSTARSSSRRCGPRASPPPSEPALEGSRSGGAGERQDDAAGDVGRADVERGRVDLGAARLRVARSASGSGSPTGGRAATGCRRGSPAWRRRRSGTGSGFAASSAAVYGCCGCREDRVDGAVLDDPAEVHDRDRVGDAREITDSWCEMKIIVRPRSRRSARRAG